MSNDLRGKDILKKLSQIDAKMITYVISVGCISFDTIKKIDYNSWIDYWQIQKHDKHEKSNTFYESPLYLLELAAITCIYLSWTKRFFLRLTDSLMSLIPTNWYSSVNKSWKTYVGVTFVRKQNDVKVLMSA